MFKRSTLVGVAAAAILGLTLSAGATFAQDAQLPLPCRRRLMFLPLISVPVAPTFPSGMV